MQIPNFCKPDETVMLGYSGGMALYVANWKSIIALYKVVMNGKQQSISLLYPLTSN